MIHEAKIHLLFLSYEKERFHQALCNLFFTDKKAVTKDSTKVTCKNCLRAYLANREQREETDERD